MESALTGLTDTRWSPARAALISALLVIAASALGSAATLPNIPSWYAGLQKPSFTPPNWIFGPVWTSLYAMMGYAFFRVMRTQENADRRRASIWFLIQLALNTSWSFAFFGARNPGLGVAVIVALWLAIAATIAAFHRIDRIATWLLAPYLAWVSYATALTVAVWRLN